MEKKEFLNQYSAVVNYSKEFKAVASSFLITENPDIDELNTYVEKATNNQEFKLWEYLRNNENKQSDPKIGYDDFIGFFKYFGIEEMEKFIHNNTGLILFEYLKNNEGSSRVYWESSNKNDFDRVKFTGYYDKIYFYHSLGYYDSIELKHFYNRCNMLNYKLLKIIRIEKEIDGEWIPTIINEDGKFYSLNKL